jgi:hypothetical protein
MSSPHPASQHSTADAAYYASAERQRLQPDPARQTDEVRKDWLIAVS